MWNEIEDRDRLETALRSVTDWRERVDVLLGLACTVKRDTARLDGILAEVDHLLADAGPEFDQQRADYLYLRLYEQFQAGVDLGASVQLGREVVDRFSDLGDVRGELEARIMLTHCYDYLRRFRELAIELENVRELLRSVSFPPGVDGAAHYNVAYIYGLVDMWNLAEDYATLAVERGKLAETGELQRMALSGAYLVLADAAAARGDLDAALGHAEASLDVATASGVAWWRRNALLSIGRIQLDRDEPAAAIESLTEAVAIGKAGYHVEHAEIGIHLARAHAKLGRHDKAEATLKQAIDECHDREATAEMSEAYAALAEVYEYQERFHLAYEALRSHDRYAAAAANEAERRSASVMALRHELALSERSMKLAEMETAELADKNARLKQSFREELDLIDHVIHALQNPLAAMNLTILSAKRAYEGGETDAAQARMARVRQAIVYMTGVVAQLGALQRVRNGVATVPLAGAALPGLLAEAAERNAARFEDKGIDLVVEVTGPLPVYGAVEILQEVADELLQNALKYTFPGGKVHVTARESGEWVEILFSDDGVGMSHEEAPVLFTKFGKLAGRPTGGEASTGIGLYAVRSRMEQAGGTIVGRSDGPGRGSTFTMIVPRSDTSTSVDLTDGAASSWSTTATIDLTDDAKLATDAT